MTIDKLTGNVHPLDTTNKINEIIDGKQDTLVSGTNIKTINNNSILGSGDLVLDGLPSQTGNTGKFLTTDGTDASWAAVPFRNIGEIVEATIPLTDAGLHLLDGALINESGIYSAFVTYIAGLVSDYPDLFETEANWQSAVSTYGVCGKFVYDSVNNTVRLPKITGIIEGTTDVTALGDLVESGLPNITGHFVVDDAVRSTATGAFYNGANFNYDASSTTGGGGYIEFDASRSSLIYGNSNTVQPQTIKVLYYIVIATSTKTDIQVDIDEVVTDLNGKADVDLTNCTKPHIVETYVNGSSWYRIYSDGWCEQGGRVQCGSGTSQSLSLLNTFVDTNYNIETTIDITNSTGSYNCDAFIGNKTSSAVTIYCKNGSGGALGTSYYFYWQACGYIN